MSMSNYVIKNVEIVIAKYTFILFLPVVLDGTLLSKRVKPRYCASILILCIDIVQTD